jgi:membrane protein
LASAAAKRRAGRAGRAPSSPTRLSWGEWLAALKRSGKQFLADDCMGLAQEVAYSSLLAFFPAVIALVGLLDLINAYSTLESFLRPVAPKAVLTLIQTFRTDTGGSGSVAALLIGLLGATWAASGAMNAIVKAVNRAYDREETRPFWKVRLISIVLVFATAVVTIGMMLLIVFGGTLGDAIARRAHLGGAFQWIWGIARWPLAFVVVLLLFGLIYSLGPNFEQRSWKWITPGALLGGVMWLALSGLFALYTAFSDSYTKTYGTLAGGIVLLLWLNYSAWAILFGAELNSELDKQADIRAAGGEHAGLVRPSRRR